MENYMDYIDWRGDITFDMCPFTEIDGLIFSQLAYIEFDERLVPEAGDEEEMTLRNLGKAYFNGKVNGENFVPGSDELLKAMIKCDRFKNIGVMSYVSEFDAEKTEQFGAITVRISDGTYVVAFRGTDATISGWEEDFKLCYMCPVVSQTRSAEYLRKVMNKLDGTFYLVGHSKGGNLAVYSSMEQKKSNIKRIRAIYNYDGPGFLQDIVDSEKYKNIMPKVQSFMPQSSIVGTIMYHNEDFTIIQSDKRGIAQHNAINWQMRGKSFKTLDKFQNASIIFSEANKAWINEIDRKRRAEFIDIVFRILKAGSDTVTGFSEDFPKVMNNMLRSFNNLDRDTKRMIRTTVRQMILLYSKTVTTSLRGRIKNE